MEDSIKLYTITFYFASNSKMLTGCRPVTVDKPIPLTFDLGNLAGFDTNPLPLTTPTTLEDILYNVSRDSAQLLINQILTAIPLKSTQEGVYAELPDPITPIPREKPVPKPKEPTKWVSGYYILTGGKLR